MPSLLALIVEAPIAWDNSNFYQMLEIDCLLTDIFVKTGDEQILNNSMGSWLCKPHVCTR
jgi:hypothetical protein